VQHLGSVGKAATPHRPGRSWDAPHCMGMKCRDPSLRPNEMSELLTAPEWNGMLDSAVEGSHKTPHRLGREWGAPRPSGMECRGPSLRPNEMSEPLTAAEGNGMLPSRRKGKPHHPPPRREEVACPSRHRVEMSEPSLRPSEMGCSSSRRKGKPRPLRSEERRVGTACGMLCRSRGARGSAPHSDSLRCIPLPSEAVWGCGFPFRGDEEHPISLGRSEEF
jgi:hypothetical protein